VKLEEALIAQLAKDESPSARSRADFMLRHSPKARESQDRRVGQRSVTHHFCSAATEEVGYGFA
jgi:hypothetical protein